MAEAKSSAEESKELSNAKPVASLRADRNPGGKKIKLFMKQKIMLRVIYALVPILISAIYFFGWRVLAVLVVTWAVGLTAEFVTSRQRGQPISMANFVTCWLFALSLPPTVPFWIAAVGIFVAILFGKEVFGGFGRNFANPAIVGRAFVYVCFPTPLTAQFVPAFKGFPGGFAHWSFESLGQLPGYLASSGKQVADAVSQASPMLVYRDFGPQTTAEAASWLDIFLGNIGGIFQAGEETRILSAGSMGEGCALLIVLAAVYLLVTRTANWRLMLGSLLGLSLATLLFRKVLGFGGLGEVPPIHFTLVAGTTLYVVVFMITDPVSAPNRKLAMYAYGGLIGFLIVLLRWRGIFVAAASFAILLGNICSPLLDIAATSWQNRRKATTAAKEGPSA